MSVGFFSSKWGISIALYSMCSASMLLINKVTISLINAPSFVTVVQLVSCAALVKCMGYFGMVKVDEVVWFKVKPYLIYCCTFALGIYASMRGLRAANVETLIVFRCMTPLIVCFLDSAFLGRETPSQRSILALCLIVLGALGYVQTDSEFAVLGIAAYFWPILYMLVLCFNMVYGKWIVSGVQLELSGTVLYTNAFSILPMVLLGAVAGEWSEKLVSTSGVPPFALMGPLERIALSMTSGAFLALTMSCVVGTGISYAGWFCRQQTSATTFTLVGVMNKIATIAINSLMWDKHANWTGILFLLLCISGGALYQQAPLAKSMMKPDEVDEDEDRKRLVGANGAADVEMFSLENKLEEGSDPR